jgi:hypothetical protein
MADWTEMNDTYTASINGYHVQISRSEQLGTWRYLISDGARAVHSGAARELEAAKEEAERAALAHEGA